ncbi:MAG: hypothetical protein ACLU37_11970 [Collinsella sp.]
MREAEHRIEELKAAAQEATESDDMNKAAEITEQRRPPRLNSPRPRLLGPPSSTPARSPSMSQIAVRDFGRAGVLAYREREPSPAASRRAQDAHHRSG